MSSFALLGLTVCMCTQKIDLDDLELFCFLLFQNWYLNSLCFFAPFDPKVVQRSLISGYPFRRDGCVLLWRIFKKL